VNCGKQSNVKCQTANAKRARDSHSRSRTADTEKQEENTENGEAWVSSKEEETVQRKGAPGFVQRLRRGKKDAKDGKTWVNRRSACRSMGR